MNAFERKKSWRVDPEKGSIQELGGETNFEIFPEEIRQKIFDSVKNKANWKFHTIPKRVESWEEANILADIITGFVGGSEIRPITENFEIVGYEVRSKGYYHYIGA